MTDYSTVKNRRDATAWARAAHAYKAARAAGLGDDYRIGRFSWGGFFVLVPTRGYLRAEQHCKGLFG